MMFVPGSRPRMIRSFSSRFSFVSFLSTLPTPQITDIFSMTALFSLILGLYCLLVMSFLFGWIRVRRQTMPIRGRTLPGISVVVAVRNEENDIHRLLHDLAAIA